MEMGKDSPDQKPKYSTLLVGSKEHSIPDEFRGAADLLGIKAKKATKNWNEDRMPGG